MAKKISPQKKSTKTIISIRERAIEAHTILQELFPNVGTFLNHSSPFQLLIAVIMSAQCTDERINKVTPALFTAYPDSFTLAKADSAHVRELIKSVNYFNSKADNIIKTAQIISKDYKGAVPEELDLLIQLPGVGRKTANVVRGQAFGLPGITVDTHVKRLSNRLGFTDHSDAVKAEKELMEIWPENIWTDFSSTLILHGRHTCDARKPKCTQCELAHLCPSSKQTN